MRLLFLALLSFALFLGTAHAQLCTVACPNSIPTLIAPKAQTTYVYSLESKTLLTPRDTQKVSIKADAEVSIVSTCEAVLNLKNVVIDGVPEGEALAAELAAKPFAFGYFNGRILGVCPAKDDEDWATNIKKSVVSALQVQFDEDMDKVDEIDFSGRCPTNYRKMKSDEGVLIVEKKKNLNLCDDRRIDLRQTPDQALGQLKELLRHRMHPMDSDLSCRMTVKDQLVSDVDCEERHILVHRSQKPLHISNVKMSLKETKDGVAENVGEINAEPKKPYLSFEHKHKNPSEADVVEVLKKLCSEISESKTSIEASFTFQKLVDKLRYLSDEETASVDEAVKSSICPNAQKRIRELFLDAAAYAASDGSIKALVKAHEAQELSITRSTALFTIVALKASPGKETVQALLPLIQSDKTIRPLLLGFSVLVRRYCEKTADCETNGGVKDARDAYLARLASSQKPTDKMSIVRALENLNVNTDGQDSMINSLDEIIKSGENDPALRAAAVSALPDDQSHMDRFKSLVKDENNPNEVRIAAFKKMAQNGGLKDVKEMFDVKGECMKNYVLTYVNNLKKAKNELRRKQLEEDVELPEEPQNKIGITRNIAREYGPYTFEYDVIYPEHDNITRTINGRITKASKENLRQMMEVQIYQKGFDKELNNMLTFLERKSIQSTIIFVKDLLKFLMTMRKNQNTDHELRVSIKINNKNVLAGDLLEDIHLLRDMLKKRVETIVNEKSVDRTIGAVLVDSKLVVPTITGLPLLYKLGDNMVLQLNGQVNGEKGDRNVKINLSLIAGLYGNMKLKIKDKKMGYEYEAKMAYLPETDMDIQKKENSLLLRYNLKDVDERTIMKFKQGLREKRSTGEEKDYDDNEVAPEARSDNCAQMFLMNYCRRAHKIKGLMLPNVEYYIVKPEKEVTALELEFKKEVDNDQKTRRYAAELTAVGSPTGKQAKAELEIIKGEEYKLLFKSPNHELSTQFTLAADKNNLKMKLDLPDVLSADLTGEFEHDKENNVRKNKFHLEYKRPHDEKTNMVDYENEFSFNLKRSSKEKNANVDYKSKYISTAHPCLNHKTDINFKYRPFKVNELNLELAYGEEMQHKYQFMRNSQMEVEEMRPFKLNGNSEIKLVASDFDVDYDLKSDFKYESNKGTPIELKYKIKGKDRSKRAVEGGFEDVEGMIDYQNSGSPIDSKMNAQLKVKGNQYAYESELKQTEPQQYEGKITLTKNDKKIFITHKDEVTKPTSTFHIKSEAEVTYSDSEDKKNYFVEFKKDKDLYTLNSNVKRNGETFYESDMLLEKNGKMKWNYRRNQRKFDLDVDNIFNAREATMMLKLKEDLGYDIKMTRVPLSYHDITVEGNGQALIKKGNLHMSLMDPIALHLLTKNDGKVDWTLDLVSPNTKMATLKIDSPKYNLYHDGEIGVSLLNQRFFWRHETRKGDQEVKLDMDLARRGSTINIERHSPDLNTKIKYVRTGDDVNMDIDGTLVEGHMKGTVKEGTVHLKGRQTDFEIESNYKCEGSTCTIVPVKSENGKLEGILSRKEASKLTLETPRVKMNMDYDRHSPVKLFKFDYDGINFERHVHGEWEPTKRYKYEASAKKKDSGDYFKTDIHGVPRKAFSLDFDSNNFKLKVNKPEDSNKAQFSYTLNDYTETDEYEFNPNTPYYLNWMSVLRQYITQFIVHE